MLHYIVMKKGNSRLSTVAYGFTLVELLVVMAIMSVLIGISVAGLGFAMRRSRNTGRQAAAQNLDRSLEAFYSDNQQYPDSASMPDLVDTELNSYLEGSWESPSESYYGYRAENYIYVVCASQEDTGGDIDFLCYGPGIGYPGGTEPWPGGDTFEQCTEPLCGICGYVPSGGPTPQSGSIQVCPNGFPTDSGGVIDPIVDEPDVN